jgi:hypothetical protein
MTNESWIVLQPVAYEYQKSYWTAKNRVNGLVNGLGERIERIISDPRHKIYWY